MLTISICATKGGTGKSTLSTCLALHASAKAKVALVDFDKQQQSATGWATLRRRAKLNGPVIATVESRLGITLRGLMQERMEYAIVDSPPTLDDEGILESVVDQADYIVSPLQPSLFDVAAARTIASAADGIPIGFVMCNAAEDEESLARRAVRGLKTQSLHVFKASIAHRPAYKEALWKGRTGPEIDKAAAAEVAALWEEIVQWTR